MRSRSQYERRAQDVRQERTSRMDSCTDLSQDSRVRVVRMTFALGYAATNSSTKRQQGSSETD